MNAFYEEKRLQSLYLSFIMGNIFLKNIQVYSYHGCMDEEKKIGSDYLVNLKIKTDLSLSSKTDKLKHTVDYVSLHKIVKEEMKISAKLLENVTDRIVERILKEHPCVIKASVKVAKKNPPVGGCVDEVAVKSNRKRTGLDLD